MGEQKVAYFVQWNDMDWVRLDQEICDLLNAYRSCGSQSVCFSINNLVYVATFKSMHATNFNQNEPEVNLYSRTLNRRYSIMPYYYSTNQQPAYVPTNNTCQESLVPGMSDLKIKDGRSVKLKKKQVVDAFVVQNNNNLNNNQPALNVSSQLASVVTPPPVAKPPAQCRYYKSGFCRRFNLKHEPCPHPHTGPQDIDFSKAHTAVKKTEQKSDGAIFKAVSTRFLADWDGKPKPKAVTKVYFIQNSVMLQAYQNRSSEIFAQRGFNNCTEMSNVYHGTHAGIISKILERGFVPPADFDAGEHCATSGHLYNKTTKKAGTSLCSFNCKDCQPAKHSWNKCHMYGLGIYFANDSAKSNQYIKDSSGNSNTKTGRQMLVCKVMLGASMTMDRHLKSEDEMHDLVKLPASVDCVFAKGFGVGASIPTGPKGGHLGVQKDEYIVFHPFQAIPEYLIEFEMS